MKCSYCGMPFEAGQKAYVVMPMVQVLMGPKSGLLGIYSEHAQEAEPDLVHVVPPIPDAIPCIIGFFDPEWNSEMWDQIVGQMREDVEAELRPELREEFEAKISNLTDIVERRGGEIPYCVECFDEVETEEDQQNHSHLRSIAQGG